MNIVDILIDVHPELPAEQCTQMEQEISKCNGVVSVHFSPDHSHELTVAYDPQTVSSQRILEITRQWDEAATMAGL
ncbi:MAG: hypothetical protein JSW10_09945 [Pseudomonadota bacterium]|nr:MAG: hypothetical protein JSW10_09945 [Pseudomonadota bacterium]